MINKHKKIEPFIKWAGGKGSIKLVKSKRYLIK